MTASIRWVEPDPLPEPVSDLDLPIWVVLYLENGYLKSTPFYDRGLADECATQRRGRIIDASPPQPEYREWWEIKYRLKGKSFSQDSTLPSHFKDDGWVEANSRLTVVQAEVLTDKWASDPTVASVIVIGHRELVEDE